MYYFEDEFFEGMLVRAFLPPNLIGAVIEIDYIKDKCLVVWFDDFYVDSVSFTAVKIWREKFLKHYLENEKLSKS